MKDKLVQVKLSEVENSMLENLCRFFQKKKSQMLRDLVLSEHVVYQNQIYEYDTFTDYDKDRDGYGRRQLEEYNKQCGSPETN